MGAKDLFDIYADAAIKKPARKYVFPGGQIRGGV
jgi:hypothetical protein